MCQQHSKLHFKQEDECKHGCCTESPRQTSKQKNDCRSNTDLSTSNSTHYGLRNDCCDPKIPSKSTGCSSKTTNVGDCSSEASNCGQSCGNGSNTEGKAKPDTCCVKPPPFEDNPATSELGCCGDKRTTKEENTSSKCGTSCCDSDHEIDCQSAISGDVGACPAHLEIALRKFSSFLQAGLCICRSVLGSDQICCDDKKRSAASKARARRSGSRLGQGYKRIDGSSKALNSDKCCQKKIQVSNQLEKDKVGKRAASCKQKPVNDCSQEVKHFGNTPLDTIQAQHQNADLEKSVQHEHLVFNISGMTCTGCTKKVAGVCQHIPGVHNASVNFVAGRGECDIDTSLVAPDKLLGQLERETGFKCSRIINSLLTLDLLMTAEHAALYEQTSKNEIESIERLRSGLYQVSFLPTRIGARDILSRTNGRLAPPAKDNILAADRKKMLAKCYAFLGSVVLTIPVVVLAWDDPPVSFLIKSIVSLVLATGVQILAIPEFYVPALKALIFSRSIEMDMLVVISITAAYFYSVVAFAMTHAGYVLEQGEFFETSTLLITLVLLGRLVSSYAKLRAVSSVSMKSLQTDTAYLEVDSRLPNAEPQTIDARLLEYNDIIKILPHSHVVTDGEVTGGSSAVDESMATGESIPVPKAPGDMVIAGTINGPGPLSVRVTRLPGQNSISDIANLVSDALKAKPKVQDLADLISGWFVPAVVGIALIVLTIWLVIATKVRGQNAGGAIGTAITFSIAVLAISCPCALGLAVPLVLVIAGGVAAKAGVVIKSADVLERSFRVTDAVFDKTGTLTLNDLVVKEETLVYDDLPTPDIISLAFSLLVDNEHPISRAVVSHLRNRSPAPTSLHDIQSVPGAGVKARWHSSVVKAGNPNWLDMSTHHSVINLQEKGLSILCLTLNDRLIGIFGLQANIRKEAGTTIETLHNRGIRCHIVSGDNVFAVKAIAQSLNIPEVNVHAQKTPEQKQQVIQALQTSSDTRRKHVVFIGDGTNDAAAIAQADVGLQIGNTSDISRAASDVVLLGGLDGIVTLLNISKAAYGRIMFNFVWSGVYNLVAIMLASGAIVKFRVPPAYAGLGEIVSVLTVIVAALSMKWLSI